MRFAAPLLACSLAAASAAVPADPPAAPAASASPVTPAAEAAPATPPTPAAPSTTATSATPAIASAAAATPATDADSEAAANERRLRTAGYKPQVINGVKVWCRTENSLGSRLAQQKNCGTAQDLERSVRETQNRVAGEQNRQWNPTHN